METNSNTARKELKTSHHPLPTDYTKAFLDQQQAFLEVQQYLLNPEAKAFKTPEEEINFIFSVAASFADRQDYIHAVHYLIQISEKYPDTCSLYTKMAEYLAKLGEHDDACLALREATRREPSNVTYWLLAAKIFLECDEYKGAHACLEKAIELQPQSLMAKRMFARLYAEIEQDEQAELIYKDIDSTGLENPDADFTKAKLYFRQGKIDEALSLYNSRFDISDQQPDNYPQFNESQLWHGEDLNGKTLFVAYEHSSPHHLLFTTLIRRLYDGYPDVNLIIETSPVTETLLATTFPKAHIFSCPILTLNDRLIHMYDAHDFTFDYWVPLGDLLGQVSTPPSSSCFKADADRSANWQEHFKPYTNKIKVGIDIQLYPTMLQQYDAWSDLLSLDSCKFIALNPHEDPTTFDEIGILPCPYEAAATLDERAACLAALDAVITPFNETGVLAAGLGIKTIQLTAANDWRMLGSETSPWFGDTVHILPHTLLQDFDSQITEMVKACRKILT